MANVPPVAPGAVPVVAPVPDLQVVFNICGITAEATRTRIIQNEGFGSLGDLSILESDSDVTDMAKRLASRTVADGRVNLGTIQIKKLQALVWWIRDQIKHGQVLDAANFDVAALNSAMERKRVEKERESADVSVKDLGKFDPDDFELHEDAFLNLLTQVYGVLGEPIRYVVRSAVPPTVFVDDTEERMYQLPLAGPSFEEDNRAVYRKLKSFLIETPGWAWIESFDAREDGRGAFWSWSDHYNGQGELSKRTSLAKARIQNLFYKNERSLPFEKVTEHLTKAFLTLDKDVDEKLSERQKVEKLLRVINTSDMELMATKAVITSDYPRDFAGACAYFSTQVARLHGGAQLESQRFRKRRISQLNTSG